MNKIALLLNDLWAYRARLAEVKAKIDAEVPSLAQERDCLTAEVERLEKAVKTSAVHVPHSQAHTLVGTWLQLVWTAPRQVLSEERALAALKAAGIDTAGLYDERPGWWSIRARGKSK